MFSMRPKRISAKLFILPALLIMMFCVAAVFDYSRQHVRVSLLGTSIGVSSVRQVLIEPNGATASPSQGYYTLTSQSDILNLCKLLAMAHPYLGNQGDFATDIDNILFESANGLTQIPVAKTNNGKTLLYLNARAYIAPAHFLDKLQQIAIASANQTKSN